MFQIDTKNIKQLVKNLERAHKDALPKTIFYTLDRMAKGTALQGKANVSKSFTLRNKYIQGSIGNKSKRAKDINAMESYAGQFAIYKGKPTGQLEKQEYGQSILAKGKYTFAATPSARGGSYKKTIRKANMFGGLDVHNLKQIVKTPTKDPRKEIPQAIGYAFRHNKSFAIIAHSPKYLRYGVFRITPRGQRGLASMLYKLNDKKTNIKVTQWLKPATDKVMATAERIFVSEANKRLEKELSKGLGHS